MKKVELLAPAKNLETAIVAINSGADAVYIGAENFGARKNAPNSLEDIKKLVDYAHQFYVKVHVVINTILNNTELVKAIELINNLYSIGVDVLIVQDMGIMKAYIDGKLPPIQIHASTQCNNRSVEKAKFFDDLGVSRVILARELSLVKIKEICDSTSCEIETFIHGALCVSYSGQCYLSYANGGRSANRGECAQPCRKRYSLVTKDGKYLVKNKYLLSLKDFNASKYVTDLVDVGVKSFKIEGRLKDVNYVKNVVAYYNNLLNSVAERTSSGKVYIDFNPDVNKTFNRGYTEYFLKEREQCFNFLSPKSRGEKIGKVKRIFHNYFEIDADLHPQDGICFINKGEMSGFLVNKVDGNKIYPTSMEGIKTGTLLYRNSDSRFEKILTNSKISRKILVNIEVNNGKIVLVDEDNNKVEGLITSGEVPKNYEKMLETFKTQLRKSGDSHFIIDSVDVKDENLPFLPISSINELRRDLLKALMEERLRNYKREIQKPMQYVPYVDKVVDYRANVFNDDAEMFYEKCDCHVNERALETTSIKSGVELMRTKHCLKFANGLCGQRCPQLYLEDEKGKRYTLRFDCKICEMIIMS